MDLPSYRPDYQKIYRECGSPQHCLHHSTELRNKPDKNNQARYHHQCLSCGKTVGGRVPATEITGNADTIPRYDQELERKSWSDFHQRSNAKKAEAERRAKAAWDRDYQQYLDSPEWKRKRQLVLLRSQGVCEGCRLSPASEVHHASYDHVGDEFLFQLLALCRSCHDRYHQHLFSAFLKRLFFAGLGQEDEHQNEDVDF